MKLFYSADYVRAGYAFDTTRKAQWVADSLQATPIPSVEIVAPEPVTEAQLCAVHHPAYVAAIRSGQPRDLAESQGFAWDPLLWPAVRASTGGVLAAARAAMREGVAGSLSSGLHHAKRGHGDGFCTFNGLALAAHDALTQGAQSVLILDFDAHCGGGTHSLVQDEPRIVQADVAVSPFDRYRPASYNQFTFVREASHYLPSIEDMLADLEQSRTWEDALCLYNAGMDPHEGCAIGGLAGITSDILAERERIVFEWCRKQRLAVAFVLAGGYVGPRLTENKLVALHRLTITSAAARSSK